MKFLRNSYHFLLSWLGNLIYRRPSRKIFVVGVTGTKGKSTVLELINAILETAGHKTALLSSVRIKIDKESKINQGNTMPGRLAIKRFLRKAVLAECSYALIEVTSEGVVQHRHRFIDWDAGVFVNLAPEHIEAHGSFEKYRDAKLSFFSYLASSAKPSTYFFINRDDPSAVYFEKIAHKARRGLIMFFSASEFMKSNIYERIRNEWLKNEFNLENAAAAAAFGRSRAISDEIIIRAMDNFHGVPGRLDFIQREPFAVVVDYAHTPDSLEKVFKTLHAAVSPNLICVLGSAGGGRDKWKRPAMGLIASHYCREIILTNEDPYDENPVQILAEIKSGIANRQLPVYEILDRKEAIKRAISLAQPGDAVIITGKGSEPWLHLAKGKKIPWNERKTVEELLGIRSNAL